MSKNNLIKINEFCIKANLNQIYKTELIQLINNILCSTDNKIKDEEDENNIEEDNAITSNILCYASRVS